uniref:C3H1-type domain-containing protein n=1 Tax=Bionectria ochroleuca TaxID=29856 RepID=A0A8H7N9R8_BIOOC
MTDEEKELLARIGRLAGQINRHKNQQAGVQSVANSSYHNRHQYHRSAGAPYPTRGNRVQRPRPHQHRTLHLNAVGNSSNNDTDSGGSDSARWVTKNDRHRQIINANVYEKESQNRAKAIEQTRQRKQDEHRRGEKARFHDFLTQQQNAHASSGGNSNATRAANNEIIIADIRFRVLDGGKKLAKIIDGSNDLAKTPKNTILAGVKFHRTKTGNLVANRIVKDHRRSGTVKKVNEPCKIFSASGSCPKGPRCRYMHDPNKVAICRDFLKEGKCSQGNSCDLSHELTPERVPDCLHFAKGHCAKPDCPFTHSSAPPGAPVCKSFGFLGYCDKGANCSERHVFECPDFSNTGRCNTKGCKLLHRERASVLRGQAGQSNAMEEDVSSDEESADSDDVDSDEVAEFLDADSDLSDFEDQKDFIAL